MGLTWDTTFIRTIPGMLMAGQIVSTKYLAASLSYFS